MLATSIVALVVAGCGGGERQDKNEPSGTFPMNVVNADFPKSQSLAKQVPMTISVKNTGTKEIPNLAVTVDSFSTRSQEQGLADPERPVWIVDKASMTVKPQPVQLAGADGNDAVVTGGLTPGQVVVTAGVHVLNPGQKVKLYVEPGAPASAAAVASVATAVTLK